MIFPHRGPLVLSLLFALTFTVSAAEQDQRLSTDLEERVEKRLIQLDVTVTGPSDVISTLTSEDFELYLGNIALGGQRVEKIYVDRMCPETAVPRKVKVGDGSGVERKEPPPTASYVFYFDQAHLSMEGRVRSLELARGLIDELVASRTPNNGTPSRNWNIAVPCIPWTP
jgi:hypothetical protein